MQAPELAAEQGQVMGRNLPCSAAGTHSTISSSLRKDADSPSEVSNVQRINKSASLMRVILELGGGSCRLTRAFAEGFRGLRGGLDLE